MDAEDTQAFTPSEFDELLHVSDNLRRTLINAFTTRQLRAIIDISLNRISQSTRCAEVFRDTVTTMLDHVKAAPVAKLKRKADAISDLHDEPKGTPRAEKKRPAKRHQSSLNGGSEATPPARPTRSAKSLVSLITENEVPIADSPSADSPELVSAGRTGSSRISQKEESEHDKTDPEKNDMSIEPLQWLLCVPNVDSEGENVVPFSALPQSTQTELEYSFDQSYGKGTTKSRRRQYAMMVKSDSQRKHYADKGACINIVVSRKPYDQMTFLQADGSKDGACDCCTDQGRLCARVVSDGGKHALYLYPLGAELRVGFGWKSTEYWVSDAGTVRARMDSGA